MIPVAWRMIWKEKARFAITAGGVGFTVMLMLFLIGVYGGARNGSTNYVRRCPAEIWVCENNSTNLLRSSSFLGAFLEKELATIKGIREVTAILRVIVSAQVKGRTVTLFLFGFDPSSRLSSPSPIVRGTSKIGPNEIIVDKAFAAKHRLDVGQSIEIKGGSYRVAGICEGTNAVVAQFVFTTLEGAQQLLGFPGIVSFYLVRLNGEIDKKGVVGSLQNQFPFLSVFSKPEFIRNNLDEVESGILPVLWTISFLGIVVGIAVITLMLYGSILEKREDYALLKAIGSPQRYLVWLVFKQSVFSVFAGFLMGLFLYVVVSPLLVRLVPELALLFTWQAMAAVFLAALVIGAVGALAPIRKLAHIYPLEVFRP